MEKTPCGFRQVGRFQFGRLRGYPLGINRHCEEGDELEAVNGIPVDGYQAIVTCRFCIWWVLASMRDSTLFLSQIV